MVRCRADEWQASGRLQKLYAQIETKCCAHIQGDTKKRELLKNPTKIEEIQQKNFIDRN